MGNDKIFFRIKSFSNISLDPFYYEDHIDFTFKQDESNITVENDEVKMSYSSNIDIKYFNKETGVQLDFDDMDIFKMMKNNNLEPFFQRIENAHREITYSNWNLEILKVKKKTHLSGLGEYIGRSYSEIINEFPDTEFRREDCIGYVNVPEYCLINFEFKDDRVIEITFIDDYY